MSHDPGSSSSTERPAWKFHARRIALIYCGFSSLWILLSDKAGFICGAMLFDDGGHDAMLRPDEF